MNRSPFPGRLDHTTAVVNRVTLERHRFAVEQVVSKFDIERWDGHEWARAAHMDAYIRRASAGLVGKKRTESVSYPATWWDAVKQRFAPVWFLKRWPAKLTTWTVDAWSLFPELEAPRAHYLELSFCDPPRLFVPYTSEDSDG